MKKIVSLIIVIVTLITTLAVPIDVNAASVSWIETVKNDVPVWSEATKYSTKKKTVSAKTVYEVLDSTVNSYDHLWYLTKDGWVYSENVKNHSHKSSMCGVPEKSYKMLDDARHAKSTTDFDICWCGARFNERYTNTSESHDFTKGDAVCVACGYTFNRVYEDCDILVEIGEDCDTFTGPTKYSQKTNRHLLKGETHRVIKKIVKNEFDNEWFVLEDGSHFFSGHVSSHQHKGIICAQGNITYEAVNESAHIRYNYSGDELCECGYKVADGTTTSTTEDHNFFQGVCTDCGFVYSLDFTENKAWVQLKEDCHSYAAPYNDSGKKDAYLAGDSVYILGSVVNERNNTWLKLDDNRFIYEGHIDHVHVGNMVAEKYQQNTEENHIAFYYDGEYCSCGFQTSYDSDVESATEEHDFSGGRSFCVKCGYSASAEEKESVDISGTEDKEEVVEDITETTSKNKETETSSDENYYEKVTEEVIETSDVEENYEDFICVDYEDCTKDDSRIFVITEDNCPIREAPNNLGKVYTRAKKDQLISVKSVFWTWRFSRWAEIRLPDSDKSYYIYTGNCEEHITHSFVNVVSTDAGEISFCTICGITLAETKTETVSFNIISILDQVLKGTYSDEQVTATSIIAQIIVGEVLPGSVSTIADIRDLLGDIHNGESVGVLLMDMVAIIPIGTMIKGGDKLTLLTKNADEITSIVNNGSDITKGARHVKAKKIFTNLPQQDFSQARKLAQNYNLTTDQFNKHITKLHDFTSTRAFKTKFTQGFDIKGAIDDALNNPDAIIKNVDGKPGYIFRKDFGKVIGWDPVTNMNIREIRVVIEPDGFIRTAFPDAETVADLLKRSR
ncbi:MAG: hypothetical protein E7544_01900 [Ruminococcaceae bacterium]|nr:hypothetical protein [Oscillospiraceae bacterium]